MPMKLCFAVVYSDKGFWHKKLPWRTSKHLQITNVASWNCQKLRCFFYVFKNKAIGFLYNAKSTTKKPQIVFNS